MDYKLTDQHIVFTEQVISDILNFKYAFKSSGSIDDMVNILKGNRYFGPYSLLSLKGYTILIQATPDVIRIVEDKTQFRYDINKVTGIVVRKD